MPSSFMRPFNWHPVLYVLVTLLVIIAIGEAIGWPFLRGPTESFMSSSLERSVKINGPFTVRFIGGIRLKSAGFWISSPEGFDAPYLLDAKDIVLNLRYCDLWQARRDKSAPIRIKTLHVKDADAYLVRHADGNSTWQFDKYPNQPSRPVPTIENLMVQNGKAVVNDPITESDLKVEFGTQEGTGQEGTSKVGATGNSVNCRSRPSWSPPGSCLSLNRPGTQHRQAPKDGSSTAVYGWILMEAYLTSSARKTSKASLQSKALLSAPSACW